MSEFADQFPDKSFFNMEQNIKWNIEMNEMKLL